MNPFDLSASDLLIWGLVLHLVADWPLQNDWMANNKALRRLRHHTLEGGGTWRPGPWWDRHPAALVHAGIHGALLALVFGLAALPLALAHLIIDTRAPVAWWSRLVRQTQPRGRWVETTPPNLIKDGLHTPLYDIGTEVRFWTDQVFHVACIAVAALAVTL